MVDEKKYVDVNVFIYWLGNHPIFGKTAYNWIKRIERATPGSYITSTLTIYEIIVVIAGLLGKTLDNINFIRDIIYAINSLKGLSLEPLESNDMINALNFMEKYNLDYEDSLHLATAIRMGINKIISNDKDFDKTPLKRKF